MPKMRKDRVALVPRGFFEISKPLKRESQLSDMKRFLENKGIRTSTIQHEGRYILCREGIEATSMKK